MLESTPPVGAIPPSDSWTLKSNIDGARQYRRGPEGAPFKHRSGRYNTAVGTSALLSNTGGAFNTALGSDALCL